MLIVRWGGWHGDGRIRTSASHGTSAISSAWAMGEFWTAIVASPGAALPLNTIPGQERQATVDSRLREKVRVRVQGSGVQIELRTA